MTRTELTAADAPTEPLAVVKTGHWIFKEGPLQILLMMVLAFIATWTTFYCAMVARIFRVYQGEWMDGLLLPPSLDLDGGAKVAGWIMAIAFALMVPIIRLCWGKAENWQRHSMMWSLVAFILLLPPAIAFA